MLNNLHFKAVLSLLLAASITTLYGQDNIPNKSFENWQTIDLGESLVDWSSSNDEGGPATVSKATGANAYNNDFAVKMQAAIENGDTNGAYIANGNPVPGESDGGVPFTQKPTHLEGYYKYNIAQGDTGLAIVTFKAQGFEIGFKLIKITGTQNTWTKFSFALDPLLVNPDTVILAFASSNALAEYADTSSWMIIDSIALTGPGVTDTIPNWDFENWMNVEYSDPVDWRSYNRQLASFGITSAFKSDDAVDGQFALKLQSVEIFGDTIGVIASPGFGQNGENNPGFPLNKMPAKLSGYYKFLPNGNDTAAVMMSFMKGDSTIGGVYVPLFPADQYTKFEQSINVNQMPDSGWIAAIAGSNTGSILFLDGLNLATICDSPKVVLGPDTVVCGEGPIHLDAGNDFKSFIWSDSSTGQTLTVENSGFYFVEAKHESGCISRDSIIVNFVPRPNLFVTNDAVVCNGDSAMLSATGADSFRWSPSIGLSDTTGNMVKAGPRTTTVYTVTGINNFGCTSSKEVVVKVNPLPEVDAGPDVTICDGDSIQLNVTEGMVYNWSPGASLNDPTIQNPVASPSVDTKYFVTVSDTNNCLNSDSVMVTVQPGPCKVLVNVTATDYTICAGDSVEITANASAGTMPYSYTWIPALDTTAGPHKVAPSGTTTYNVTVVDNAGDTAEGTVVITVIPPPIVDAGNDTSICEGQSVKLMAAGGSIFNWSPATGLNNANISSPTASPDTTTTYVLTTSNEHGCMAKDTVVVMVDTIPDIIASGDTSICKGDTVMLSASGGAEYSWSPGHGLDDPDSSSTKASPTGTTTYIVMGTDTNGCSNTDTVTVEVHNLPEVLATGTASICQGDSTELQASGSAGTFEWIPAASLTDPDSANTMAKPTATTTYTVTGTDTSGCTNTAEVVVTVYELPDITASADTTICKGDSAQLSVTGGVEYMWTPDSGLSDTSGAEVKAGVMVNTIYTVFGTDSNGCISSDQVQVSVQSKPEANFTFTVNGLTVAFSDSSTSADSWEWDFDDGNTSTDENPQHTYADQDSTYEVQLIATNECGADSVTKSVTIEAVGIWEMAGYESNIYPNPSNGVFTIELNALQHENLTIHILDITGKVVMNRSIGQVAMPYKEVIRLNELPEGTYFLNILDNKRLVATQQLIISLK